MGPAPATPAHGAAAGVARDEAALGFSAGAPVLRWPDVALAALLGEGRHTALLLSAAFVAASATVWVRTQPRGFCTASLAHQAPRPP
jgi:hypothetical protein